MKFKRYLSQKDATTLSKLAEQLLRARENHSEAVEELIELFASCILLPQNAQKVDYVSLYSIVTCLQIEANRSFSLVIVCPDEANERIGHISVLTPLAMALIGRVKYSITEVEFPFDNYQSIKVMDIKRPSGKMESWLNTILAW